jgi:glycosyltransferase EpsD
MARKVLFCATVDVHFKAFHLPYLNWFKEQGWEVHIAAAGNMELPFVDKKFNIPIQRSPFKKQNIWAYNQLKSIIDENNYDIVHCHTPMGGVLARLAARDARKLGTKVIYTAHGFHFCKGAPLINWLVYYPIEKVLSQFTDCLITINEEDYALAVNHRFKAKRVEHVHGVGVNTEHYKPIDDIQKRELRETFGYKSSDFLMLYAAEFNKNKNQQFLIGMLALLKEEIPQARLLLAGEGILQGHCRELAKQLGVADMIDFLGYRLDIDKILPMCDIAVASSVREGIPINIMEAMSCGLPVIATDNRGHRELVQNFGNGFVIDPDDKNGMFDKIIMLSQNKALKHALGMSGREMIEKKYAINKVLEEKKFIYSTFMDEKVEVEWAIR